MTSLRMTSLVIQRIVHVARALSPDEVCGFVVASKETPDVGTRFVQMQNVHPRPREAYLMDSNAVRLAYSEFDQLGEEPVAVFHSHPVTGPELSADDLRGAGDTSLAYVVVSLAGQVARMRAYRLERFVGEVTQAEVPIESVQPQRGSAVQMPIGPWALHLGNTVRITYRRASKSTESTMSATVTMLTPEAVHLDPEKKTSPRMIPLEHVRAVHVLKESPAAAVLRSELMKHAGRVRSLVGSGETETVPVLVEALHRAFPVAIATTMSQP